MGPIVLSPILNIITNNLEIRKEVKKTKYMNLDSTF